MEVYGIIYKISCSENNKSYIGQTIKTMEERWNDHKRDFKRFLKYKYDTKDNKKRNFCTYLYNAINKYGIENFHIETICCAKNKEQLNSLENENIIKFNTLSPNGFNLTSGGEGGWKFSQDTLK